MKFQKFIHFFKKSSHSNKTGPAFGENCTHTHTHTHTHTDTDTHIYGTVSLKVFLAADLLSDHIM